MLKNVLSGKLTYLVGFAMIALGGFDLAATYFGLPDIASIEGKQLVLEGFGFIGLRRGLASAIS